MTDRDNALANLRAQAGGIDPAVDQAINYARGVRAVQEVTRQQGQVMSAALANNHQLYHDNKRLRSELEQARAERAAADAQLRIARETIEREREAHKQALAKLGTVGGDRFRGLYEQAVRTMTNWLYAELSPEELKQRLEEMKAQAAEISKLEGMPTPQEIADSGANAPEFAHGFIPGSKKAEA